MVNPPAAVKLGLESICLILNQETSDWKTIRGIIVKENFINTIINFQTENISPQTKSKMEQRFLNNPDYDFNKINNASQACGPLVKWATAQIQYADMLHKVEPLRDELKSLEDTAKVNEKKAKDLESVIQSLEKSITQYKTEYADLISQAQAIKNDLNSVETKVARSVALLNSLSSEKVRWEASSESFKVQMSTIVGDVLVSSALMAYGGYFDQAMRTNLFNTWISSLQNASIKFKEDLARIEYLSSADERMNWTAAALPTDDLCIENAIMLKRFNRYPLIIDPSGQATEFIMNMYKDRKITKTSFLDNSFRKNLESALRFGNPILIQDVENYDPILNPVLNREIRRTGGRVLITLGDQDIDFSPMFTMFLSTRDPTVEFPPDICSRVTFVNFTVTRASLQAQCLHQVLKCERPDVEEKRLDLLKAQGEFQQRLRHLEKDLLGSLNESKGKILDDDSVISRLEKLKQEASEISRKVAETDQVMKEVDTVINQYLPLSQSCSSIYFTMESLNQIHSLYQYSLQYFLEIFNTVLTQNSNLNNVKDSQQRLKLITKDLFYLAYYRLARGMLHEDRLVLALLFCKIYLKGFFKPNDYQSIEMLYRILMNSNVTGLVAVEDSNNKSNKQILNNQQLESVNYLTKKAGMSVFSELRSKIEDNSDEFFKWLEHSQAESLIPDFLVPNNSPQEQQNSSEAKFDLNDTINFLKRVLLIKALRPDRFISIAVQYVNKIFGQDFLNQAERIIDLVNIVENEIKSTTPVLMCSVAGYDASGRVEDLAVETNRQLISIAIGSSEGFTQAEKAINNSSKNGRWVLLKNVHLAPSWLVQLEKKLHNLQVHPGFRLFLSMEINPKIPSNLLRLGRALVFEPPPGIKANLMRTLSVIPPTRMNRAPAERSRLYFLLCWLHAIVQERLRYIPLGWSKMYEFNESDLRCGLDTIDVWIDSVAMGRTNLPPNKVPFSAIYSLLSECVYGGKIDNAFDRRLLNTFLKQLFSIEIFDNDYCLIKDEDQHQKFGMPDALKKEDFIAWIDGLKQQQTPSWLGLPNSAEKVLLSSHSDDCVSKLLKLSVLDEEDEELAYEEDNSARSKQSDESKDSRPSWMRQLQQSVHEWILLLPKYLQPIRRTQENIKDPLFRFFEREINSGFKLLKTVQHDLNDVLEICLGNKKQTNYHRQLLKDLAKGLIPKNWRRYTVPKNLIVQPWLIDFAERIKQLSSISTRFAEQGLSSLKSYVVWLGGLFTPEAYITATRQFVAQSNSWSLEELTLQIRVLENESSMQLDACSFALTGLKLQGASCNNNVVNLSTNIVNPFPVSVIRWIREADQPAVVNSQLSKINLPIYLNSTRSELLFTINIDTDQNENAFFMRGVAILASSLSG
jgi:dynein heavy chain 1